jgi:hypothetical protein
MNSLEAEGLGLLGGEYELPDAVRTEAADVLVVGSVAAMQLHAGAVVEGPARFLSAGEIARTTPVTGYPLGVRQLLDAAALVGTEGAVVLLQNFLPLVGVLARTYSTTRI